MTTPTLDLDVEGPAAPPRSNGELVFAEPWEGRAFGLTMALVHGGTISYETFRTALVERISAWEAAPPGGGALQLLPLLVAGPGTGPHQGGTGRDGPGGRAVGRLRSPAGGSRPRARPRQLTQRPENGTEPTPPSPPGKAVGSAQCRQADSG